ncbi:hypothetical protein [Arhodomonas sp. AD133]|uniref:hypothetical protein n=1 Tax=Arhodomonas sp. AD133 TaxID=3415009 RepID=UPI003EBE0D59
MDPSLQDLEALIGREVTYQGRTLRVVDVIAEGPALVLGEPHVAGPQRDQFGQSARRAPGLWTIPVFEAPGRVTPLLTRLGLL